MAIYGLIWPFSSAEKALYAASSGLSAPFKIEAAIWRAASRALVWFTMSESEPSVYLTRHMLA